MQDLASKNIIPYMEEKVRLLNQQVPLFPLPVIVITQSEIVISSFNVGILLGFCN